MIEATGRWKTLQKGIRRREEKRSTQMAEKKRVSAAETAMPKWGW